MSLEIKNPLFYFGKFTPGIIPTGARRIYIEGKFNNLGCPESIEARGLDSSGAEYHFDGSNPMLSMLDRYQPCVDDLGINTPVSMINDSHFHAYKCRLGIDDSEYGEMINVLADVVIYELTKHNIKPHAFVAIPTRKEVSTSRAINVIRKNFTDSGITPYFLVLHNDKNFPLVETLDDLDKARNEKDVFIIDLMFTDESTIGDARAIPSDIIMEVNSHYASNIPMITADADITAVMPKTYRSMVEGIDSGFTAVTALSEFDSGTIKDNKTFYVTEVAKAIYYRVLENVGAFGPGLVGVGFCMNMKVLPVLGGFPRANQLEDALLQQTITARQGESSISFLPISLGLTMSDGSKHANAVLNGSSRYETFDEICNELRIGTSPSDLDLERVVPIINNYIENGLALLGYMSPDAGRSLKGNLKLNFGDLCRLNNIPVGTTGREVKLHLLQT